MQSIDGCESCSDLLHSTSTCSTGRALRSELVGTHIGHSAAAVGPGPVPASGGGSGDHTGITHTNLSAHPDTDTSTSTATSSFWKIGASGRHLPGTIKPVYGAQHPPLKPLQHPLTTSSQSVRSDGARSRPQHGGGGVANHHYAGAGPRPSKPASTVARGRPGHTYPRPPPTTPNLTNLGSRTFQEYQRETCDAWELDDADVDLLSPPGLGVRVAAGVTAARLSPERVQAAALEVISQHQAAARAAAAAARGAPTSTAEIHHRSRVKHHPAGNYPISKMSAYQQLNELPDRESSKLDKFHALIKGPMTDLDELRKLSWSGIPREVRADTWKLLSGYLPANVERRAPTLESKRSQYFEYIKQYYHTRHEEQHVDMYRQIHIDIPRMNPLISLFQQEVVQEIFERILYIWAMRHPASGYVQGINDLVTPFFVIFLSDVIDQDINVENFDVNEGLDSEVLSQIEADSFWCTSRLLDGIQDNYTFAQPGIQIKVNEMRDLVKRIDATLDDHISNHHVEYLQFTFRWMNNLLMREIPLRCTIRLWDTYLSEPDGFATFHLYVCVAFLIHWSKDIRRENDFQGIMLLLQNLPTAHWGNEEIGLLLAEAFKLKYMFADAPNHIHMH